MDNIARLRDLEARVEDELKDRLKESRGINGGQRGDVGLM